ncbi:MAG: hypothetical protein ACK578_16305 [Pirellula sp.]|jgi:hypothetical protein
MPVVIRKIVDQRFHNFVEIEADSWDLRTQIESLENWMAKHSDSLDNRFNWVADIGFTSRADATGGGPPLTIRLMTACVNANLEIYLSEYGLNHGESVE